MCLITHLKEDVKLDIEKVRTAFYSNTDGWGIMAYDKKEGNLLVEKSLETNYDEFIEVYKKVEGMEMGIHFRSRTHGLISLDNCHPFKISDSVYMMHNGTIPRMEDPKFVKSDSCLFAEGIKSAVEFNLLEDQKYLQLMENVLGRGNRLLFFNNGKFQFINKHIGIEENGAWYSTEFYFGYGGCGLYPGWDYYSEQETKYRPLEQETLFMPDGYKITTFQGK